MLITHTTVIRYHCTQSFPINKLNQKESYTYIINDIICKKSYIGSTNMRDRLSTYKNHIQTGHKECEIATHFNMNPLCIIYSSQKDLDTAFVINLALSAIRPNIHSNDLKSHFNITLIDLIDLSDCKTRIEKRNKIERQEGHWQTELRTMQTYGGLDKKDERGIANNKTARFQ